PEGSCLLARPDHTLDLFQCGSAYRRITRRSDRQPTGGGSNMATKRDGVFVWITWLSRVMAGEQNCEWATWFKAHYENYDKAPSDFDTVKWNIEHTRQLRRLQLERRKLGERVFL